MKDWYEKWKEALKYIFPTKKGKKGSEKDKKDADK